MKNDQFLRTMRALLSHAETLMNDPAHRAGSSVAAMNNLCGDVYAGRDALKEFEAALPKMRTPKTSNPSDGSDSSKVKWIAHEVTAHCPECGSEDIVIDAAAKWNCQLQEWELACTHDTVHCEDCDAEFHEPEYRNPPEPIHDASLIYAMFWFIENVTADHPLRTDYFFALRDRIRAMQEEYGDVCDKLGRGKGGVARAFIDKLITD